MMIKKIGLLFSLSGTISIVGEGQLQAALLAIQENNQSSFVQFQPIIRDVRSDPKMAAKEAYFLFRQEKIDALIGCYMSSVRNAVISVLNETHGLLLYPTLYEGEQIHPNVFYLGAVPNQQVEPLLCWTFHHISSNFILVGSDYIYPRSTNKQVRYWIENAGGKVLSESYFPLGCINFDKFFNKLKRFVKTNVPIVIFSTLVGESVPSFYNQHYRNRLPFTIVSPITSEREISKIDKAAAYGHICASAYFQSINSENNQRFVQAFEQKFGKQPISREMMTTYDAVRLLSMAFSRSAGIPYGKNETEKVCTAMKTLSLDGPEGKLAINPNTQHLWQWSHIGRINQEGSIEVIWSSPGPIPPKHEICPSNPSNMTALGEIEDMNIDHHDLLIGKNKIFTDCIKLAKIAARTSSPVLITGDTGTGKDILANFIHRNSTRTDKKLVAINCANLPRELIESELFGYEEGAFTGARRKGKPGILELANGGTLFLDEIGEMSIDLQAHLLRIIENKTVCRRIGGTKTKNLDIRFIAASNKNLHQEMAKGTFRRDLFFRLSVFHIHLPRLCERKDDIALLAEYFLQKCSKSKRVKKVFTPEALKILENHDWVGNVRELSNVVERCFYISQDSLQIGPEFLHPIMNLCPSENESLDINKERARPLHDIRVESQRPPYPLQHTGRFQKQARFSMEFQECQTLRDMEKQAILQVLDKSGYNLSKTAQLLKIGRSTLYRKLKMYNIDTPPWYGSSLAQSRPNSA